VEDLKERRDKSNISVEDKIREKIAERKNSLMTI